MFTPELRHDASLTLKSMRLGAPPTPSAGIARQLRTSTALRWMFRATAWSGVSIAIMSSASANPTGGNVVSGQANINQVNPNRTEITQTTDRAAINWQSFNIGANQYTVFFQPSSSSVALNRVLGADPSVIAGHLQANGNLILINPNGVLFSAGSQVNVHSIVATTADIRDRDFNDGRFNFSIPSSNPNATVVNAGTITVADHGLAALVAPGTQNSGVITAKFGRVMLAGAQTFTVDLYGDGLLSFDITSKVKGANVGNTGKLEADGGVIQLSASSVDDIVAGVINMGGTVAANSVGAQAGAITADAGANGQLNVTGLVSAQGANAGETGGAIALTGGNVAVASGASIDASGSAGGGSIKVGGGFHGSDAKIANAQTTTIGVNAVLDASAVQQGTGGSVVVWSDKKTSFAGTIRAKGGVSGGDGGKAEVSSKGVLAFTGHADLSAPKGTRGTLLLDPTEIDVVDTAVNPTEMAASDLASQLATANVDLVADTIDFKTSVAYAGTTDANLAAHATTAITLDHDVAISASQARLNVAFDAGTGGAVTLGAHSSIGTNGGNLSLAAGTGGLSLDKTASLTTTGGTLGDGLLSLSAPKLLLTGTINAGAGALSLTTTDTTAAGTIADDANAVITAGSLTGSSGGDTSLTLGNNTIGNLHGFTVGNTGNFSLTDAGALTIDGAIAVPGTLTLKATSITEQAGGTITAGVLTGATTGGDVALDQTGNAISKLASFTTSGGKFSLTDGIALEVGTSTATTAVATAGGDVALTAPDLTLDTNAINSGAGKTTITALATKMSVGTGPTGGLTLDDTELGQIKAGGGLTLVTQTGNDITVGAVTDHSAGFTSLALHSGGNLNLNGALTVGAGSGALDLVAAGSITENVGPLTVGTLTGGAGNVLLDNALNNIAKLGAFSGTGDLTLNNGANALAITGTVTAPGILTLKAGTITENTGGAVIAGTLTGTSSGNVALTNANNSVANLAAFTVATDFALNNGANPLAITGAVNAPGTLNLAAGSITELGGGSITAGKLTGASTGDVLLTNGNAIGDLSDFTLAAGNFNLNNASTALTIDGAVIVPGTLTLNAGSITENASGAITAGTLTGSTQAAIADFSQGTNAIANLGAFSTSVTVIPGLSVAGSFSLVDGSALTVTGPVSTSGSLVNGNLSLTAPSLSLTGSLDAGVGQVSLAATGAGGAITESNTARINAGTLIGSSNHGDVSLDQGNNTIGTLAGFTTGGGKFALTDGSALNVSALVSTSGGDLSLTVPGLTLGAPTSLDSGSGKTTITALGQPISVGNGTSGGLALTDAELGQINAGGGLTLATQTGQGIVVDGNITAHPGFNSLALNSGGNIDIGLGSLSTVTVNSLALNAAGAINEDFSFSIFPVLTFGFGSIQANSLTGSSGSGASLTGSNQIAQLGPFTSTGSGGIALTDIQPLAITGAVNAGTGNLSLNVTGNLTIGGNLSAGGTMNLVSTGTINQTTGTITANTLTGSSTGAATLIADIANLGAFNSAGFGLTVAQPLNVIGAVNAGSGDLTLHLTAGNLTLGSNLTAAGTVALNVDAGAITQTGGIIAAGALTGMSTGGATFAQNNAVTNLGAFTNTGPGGFSFTNGQTLTVAHAVDAGGGDLSLHVTAGSLIINDNLTAATGAVALTANTGSIAQSGGIITAGSLTGSSAGSTALNQGNAIANLGPFTAAGGFSLTDGQALTVAHAVNAGSGGLNLHLTAGDLVLNDNLIASLGTVALNVDAGSITQTGGTITALNFTGSSAGGAAFNQANAINNVGPFTNTGAGGFSLHDALQVLIVNGAIDAGTQDLTLKVTGPAGGGIGVFANLTAGGSVDIDSTGVILEANGGIIAAHALTGSSVNGTLLNDLNKIDTLARFTNTGANGVTLVNVQSLNVVGPVDAGSSDLSLHLTSGNLALNGNLTAAANTVALTVDAGSIVQNGGTITANGLSSHSAGGTDLAQPNNQIADLVAISNGGGGDVVVKDGRPLMIGGSLTNPGGRITIESTAPITLGTSTFVAGNGVEIGAPSIKQTGNASFSQTPFIVLDATGASLPQNVNPASAKSLLASFSPGGGNGDIALTNFSAPNSSVLLAANAGHITATGINARNLAVFGAGGSAALFGTIGNIAGETAAQIVGKSGQRENDYRFNNCAIGSITCTVLPSIVPAKPASVVNLSILTQQQFTDPTINLLNVGTEDLF